MSDVSSSCGHRPTSNHIQPSAIQYRKIAQRARQIFIANPNGQQKIESLLFYPKLMRYLFPETVNNYLLEAPLRFMTVYGGLLVPLCLQPDTII